MGFLFVIFSGVRICGILGMNKVEFGEGLVVLVVEGGFVDREGE